LQQFGFDPRKQQVVISSAALLRFFLNWLHNHLDDRMGLFFSSINNGVEKQFFKNNKKIVTLKGTGVAKFLRRNYNVFI
jgi:hypothetical protein